jgi:hypothetical protein
MSGVPWRIIIGSGLDDWIYLHFCYNYSQIQSLVTVDNWWLSKTHSIPSWTKSVFSSTVTDLHKRCLTNAFLLTAPVRLLLTTDFNGGCLQLTELLDELPFITWCGPETEYPFERFIYCNLRIHCHGNACLLKKLRVSKPLPHNGRSLQLHHSGFQAFWHTHCHGNMLSKALPSNGLFQLPGVMSQYEDVSEWRYSSMHS